MQYLFIVLITFFASFIQRVSGFGFGIFAMIFLPYFFGVYGEANILSSIVSTASSVIVCLTMLKYVSWKNIFFPVLGSVFTMIFAVQFMKGTPSTFMRLLLGVALVLLSIFFIFFSGKVHIRTSWYGGLIAGALSGILGGLFAMGGPPVVIYFMESEKDTKHYLATIQTYFAISNLYGIILKASAGFATPNVLICCVIGSVGMLAGTFVGTKTYKAIKPDMIKKIVYVVMAFSGVTNIITSLI